MHQCTSFETYNIHSNADDAWHMCVPVCKMWLLGSICQSWLIHSVVSLFTMWCCCKQLCWRTLPVFESSLSPGSVNKDIPRRNESWSAICQTVGEVLWYLTGLKLAHFLWPFVHICYTSLNQACICCRLYNYLLQLWLRSYALHFVGCFHFCLNFYSHFLTKLFEVVYAKNYKILF